MKRNKSSLWRTISIFLGVLLALVTYAYGFQVTKVNLAETKSERRQTQLVRILRALAKPDLFKYNVEEVVVEQSIYIPCPASGYTAPERTGNDPYILITPACANPGDTVVVQGFNMEPNMEGPVNFIPPSGVKLQLGKVTTDDNGDFTLEAELPDRASDEAQLVSMTTRKNVGAPFLSQTAFDTWDKIVETVFLALLATSAGMLLAIPLSFFAARNLMQDITMPFYTVTLNILVIPVGIYLGSLLTNQLARLTDLAAGNIWVNLAGIVVGTVIVAFTIRKALPASEIEKPSAATRTGRTVLMLVDVIVAIVSLLFLSNLATTLGKGAAPYLGSFGFIGSFVSDIGEILRMILVVVVALIGAGVASSLAGKVSRWILKKATFPVRKTLAIITAIFGGAMLFIMIMAGINWLYQIDNPVVVLWIPAILGGAAGLVMALVFQPKTLMPIGMVIYYVSRTIFNVLRSIEALIMVIVFVVWVGIGPFAGVLALGLHTIAALAKLYSEQVESILAGPLEAITATGANRLQTIVYAVIPQIIPPYISFTMYRWDINVRMSTIIGFAGGGGIGFLLIQNINLLNYRAASAQMIAIALVVALMDWLSSKLRQKMV